MKLIGLILFVIILLASPLFALIQVEKIAVGLDGYIRGDRWVPVVFEFRNPDDDFIGTLEILKGETIFRKSLHIAAGTRKRVELVYYHSNYYEALHYRILDQKNRVILKNPLDVRVLNYQDNFLLVISNKEYNHQFLNGTKNPWGGKTFIGYVKAAEIYPEWLAYSSADAIAIGDLSPSEISDTTWKALIQAIASGSILVCSPATSLAVLQNHLLKNNLPEISVEMDRISNGEFLISAWASRSSEAFPKLAVPAQSIRIRPCDRPLTGFPDGSPLITSSPFYKGNIIYFAFDYSRLPEETNVVFANFWNDVIFSVSSGAPSFGNPFRRRLEENPRIQKFLYDVPGLHLPDVKWFALFFFIYSFAIGPFQYFLLRMLKKNSLLWLSFPAIIILFSVTSFGYTRYRHSSERRITQASVVEIFPPLGQQTVYQVFGVATNASGTFRFQAVPENSFLRKFVMQSFNYAPEPYTLSEDLPHQLVGETLKNWTFRTFDAIATDAISIPLELQIDVHDQELHGTVANHSRYTINESFFFYDEYNAIATGSIEPGRFKTFSIPLNNSKPVPFAVPQLRDLLHLYNLSYAYPHFFFGKIDEKMGALVVNGENRPTTSTKYIAEFIDTKEAGRVKGWAKERP